MKRFRSMFLFLAAAIMLALALFSGTAGEQTAAADAGSPASGPALTFLSGPNEGHPLDIALAYLRDHRGTYGLSEADLENLVVTDAYTSDNGVTHIYLQQRWQGVRVHNAVLNINIAADGSVINVGNRFVRDLAHQVVDAPARLDAVQAVQMAAAAVGLTPTEAITVQAQESGADGRVIMSDAGISREDIPVQLVYQVTDDGVRLAWEARIYTLDAANWYEIRVDAATGVALDQNNLVIHDEFDAPGESAPATTLAEVADPDGRSVDNLTGDQYRVLPMPVESPNHGSRSLVVDPAHPLASPFGWHDTNGVAGAESNFTRGNNVDAYEDTNNSNGPSSGDGSRADGGSALSFDFPINFSQQPSAYQDAAITNLFYWNNIIHDVFYQYGFDEAAGNFQENNYGNGGAASDGVYAEAQDGGGTNNANFATPADGSNPRMQMYVWNLTSPNRDGDLDNSIIVHEYGHGISNRLTGGPSAVSCLNNTEQMGEGWSDYFALMLTMEAGDSGVDRRGIGTYALGEPVTGDGIRDFPYSTDMNIDPRTYDAIKTASIPHGIGSTWAAMLWEVTWALIDTHGYDADIYGGTGGNNLALQLVVDGLKLQPCSPGFVDGRDAILLADQLNNGGANQCVIWEAFAKRGLGYGASQGSSGSRSDGVESYQIPPECQGPPPTATPGPAPVCTVYSSADVPIGMPYGVTTANSSLSVSGSDAIVDMNVSVDLSHTWVGDVSVSLTHQNTGTSATLIDQPGVPSSTYGCDGDNIVATLDDEASLPVEGQCAGTIPTISGTYSPNQALSAFDGESGNGNWTLTVNDAYAAADFGTLNGWQVEICTVGGVAPTATSVPPTATSVPPTATSVPPTATSVPPTATSVPPTATSVPPTATNVPPTATNVPPTATSVPPSNETIYISSSTNGSVGSVSFADEDIIAYANGSWSLYFDGSDVGWTVDLSAFTILNDGSILMSTDATSLSLPGAGAVDDSDIVRFVPTSLGANTAGSFELYFDGSDVGLSSNGEDIDGIHQLDDGRIIISVLGSASVPGVSGIRDEDMIIFTPTSLGSNTSGSWDAYFDGSDVGLGDGGGEDVWGIWVDPLNGDIYLTTSGDFAVDGVTGDGADILMCTPNSLGVDTSCNFSFYWDGDATGLAGEIIDGLDIVR